MSKKNLGGRPPKYETVEELEQKIEEYFSWCDSEKKMITTEKGGVKIIYEPYTISGLCIYLDICRDTLSEWGKKDNKFSDTVKKAKQKVENWVEKKALTGELNATFSIFNLKNNFNWKDKTEQEVTTITADDEILNAAKKRMGIIGDKDDKE